jgi:hypothetical protein
MTERGFLERVRYNIPGFSTFSKGCARVMEINKYRTNGRVPIHGVRYSLDFKESRDVESLDDLLKLRRDFLRLRLKEKNPHTQNLINLSNNLFISNRQFLLNILLNYSHGPNNQILLEPRFYDKYFLSGFPVVYPVADLVFYVDACMHDRFLQQLSEHYFNNIPAYKRKFSPHELNIYYYISSVSSTFSGNATRKYTRNVDTIDKNLISLLNRFE